MVVFWVFFFFFQAEDGIRDGRVTGVQTCALPILVLSPIGSQGFLLGRGNLEASPEVLRRIGTRNLIAVATPGKLAMTPVLRVDTGDAGLDEEFRSREYLFVLIGYRTSKLHPIQR